MFKDLTKLCERDEIFQTGTEKNMKLTPIMFEYIQSFKLLCINEGWEWTSDIFIKVLLRKALEEERAVVNKDTSKKLLSFYLLVQGIIISQMCPKSSLAIALEAINSYELFLNKDSSFVVQCASAESLLHLASFDPIKVFTYIQNWLEILRTEQLNDKLPTALVNKLKCTFEFYKKQLPNNIVILI